MTEELKNCPFCNGEPRLKSHDMNQHGIVYIQCYDCDASSRWISWRMYDCAAEEDEALAVEAWNKRA